MRSSGRSADTSRANAGVAMSISSIVRSRFSVGRVVRGDRDHAGPIGSVAPGVVGASLHDGVARLQLNLFGVEHECNLAFENEAKIERPRPLHVGMRRVCTMSRSAGRTHGLEKGPYFPDAALERSIGRQSDDAAHGPAFGWLDGVRQVERLPDAFDISRSSVGHPNAGR